MALFEPQLFASYTTSVGRLSSCYINKLNNDKSPSSSQYNFAIITAPQSLFTTEIYNETGTNTKGTSIVWVFQILKIPGLGSRIVEKIKPLIRPPQH
jgi:hypothetical protein